MKAADLPEGSIVASDVRVWIKRELSRRNGAPWSRTGSAEPVGDARIDAVLASGRGAVLRHGYGDQQ